MSLEQNLGRSGGLMPGDVPQEGGGLSFLSIIRVIGAVVGIGIIFVGLSMVYPLFHEVYAMIKEPKEMSQSVDKWMNVVLGEDKKAEEAGAMMRSEEAQMVDDFVHGAPGRAMCVLIIALFYLMLARIGIGVFVGGGKLVALCTDEMKGVKKLLAQLAQNQNST